ncbi:MAG: flagellar assembly peptidoglycan hydrolase FlgJ [Gammaproteobacteria bacterium]|nr:flagellar assembly peptidoglycan hydrolase FlgJ [Gammaproteobacteria bacterium]
MAAIHNQAPQTTMDFAALAELRSRAGTDSQAVTAEAARQFEALFVQMMLQSMRSAGDVFGDGSDKTYRDMFDRQVALELSRGKGLGIAELLTRQLAPPGEHDAADPLRAFTATDFVAAREAALPAAAAARIEPQDPDVAGLRAATPVPQFDLTAIGAPWPAADATARQNWRPGSQEEFVRDVWPLAERAGAELGVDPRAIVAQAALETGWGRNVARDSSGMSGNNPFNIKADTRWDGQRVSVRTIEFEQGLPRPQVAAFRAYPNLQSAFEDYVQFMKSNPRYTNALANGARAEQYADSLQSSGYATDPGYAGKLRSILASPRFNELLAGLKNSLRMPTL